jgi:hypothetical protein
VLNRGVKGSEVELFWGEFKKIKQKTPRWFLKEMVPPFHKLLIQLSGKAKPQVLGLIIIMTPQNQDFIIGML